MKVYKIILCFFSIAIFLNASDYNFYMMKATPEGEARRNSMKNNFVKRMQKDQTVFSAKELKEIEDLYQVANVKSHTTEAKDALKKLIYMNQYTKTNRMGCAYLYLGTMDIIPEWEKIEFLKTAIENYSDCWYGDGVQVGAYARYMLGKIYYKKGELNSSQLLFDEILNIFPNSIDHEGNLLKEKILKLDLYNIEKNN